VRDVADLHIRCMLNPVAKGERFLAVVGDNMLLPEIAHYLREQLGKSARRVPSIILPNWFVKVFSLFDASVAQVLPELGKLKNASNEKAIRMLGWNPISREDSILATAKSLIKHGIV
jgi:dihydroflavonol-4-reductase